MSWTFESQEFENVFTGTGGGGVPFHMVGVGGINRCVTVGYFYRAIEDVRFQFTASDKTIYILDDSEAQSFSNLDFEVGYKITFDGTASNDSEFTITEISEDGRTITVLEAVVNETIESASGYDTTPVTDLNYFYNLIENSESPTFYSKTDTETEQVYTVSNLDATDTIHEVSFRVLTKSRAWVPNVIDVEETGETSEVTIVGGGVVNFRQYFTITHNYKVTPIYTPDLFTNFTNNVAPPYYQNGKSLKYISRIEGRVNPINSEPDHIGEKTNVKGIGSWYNQAIFGRKNEFYSPSINYIIGIKQAFELDVNQSVDVQVELKSVTGLFVAGQTRVYLQFNTCSNDIDDLQNTETTLLQNQFVDTANAVLGAAAVNGDNFGTGYQAITDLTFTYVDANTVYANFTFLAGADLIAYWESKSDEDRNYVISLYTDDSTNTETDQSVSNPVLATFDSAAWNKTDTTLLQAAGSGTYGYYYPDDGVYGVGNFALDEGDPVIIEFPFRVYNAPDADLETPTIKSVAFQVLATKAGKDDFILEETVLDCSGFLKLDYVQQLDVDRTRGFISYEDDPRNMVVLTPDDSYDAANYAGYIFRYGFVARYEDWINAYLNQRLMANGTNSVPDVAKEIGSVTQKWANYSGVSGWALKARITIIVTGTDGYDNPFEINSNMTVVAAPDITWAGIGGGATQEIQYFKEDESEETGTIVKEGITLVRTTWTGDYPFDPTIADSYYASMIAVLNNTGSIFDQRFASSEIESEDSSPWSPTDADPLATTSYANGNLRINIFGAIGAVTSINVEGYFDSRYLGNTDEKIHIIPRLGIKYTAT